jgi:cytochrome c biogenesis protein CcmG/thiol:disulfide interchange protein DsbE
VIDEAQRQPAPAITGTTLDGDSFSLESYRGKITLLNVWASWCVSCRAEHAELMRLSRELKDVQILGLNWKDTKEDALRMLKVSGDPYRVNAFDPDNRVGIHWGVYGAPETFLVDAEGRICYKKIGPVERGTWDTELAPTLDLATKKCKEPGR